MFSVNNVGGTKQLSRHQSKSIRILWKHVSGLAKRRKASSWEGPREETNTICPGVPASGFPRGAPPSEAGRAVVQQAGQLCTRSSEIAGDGDRSWSRREPKGTRAERSAKATVAGEGGTPQFLRVQDMLGHPSCSSQTSRVSPPEPVLFGSGHTYLGDVLSS